MKQKHVRPFALVVLSVANTCRGCRRCQKSSRCWKNSCWRLWISRVMCEHSPKAWSPLCQDHEILVTWGLLSHLAMHTGRRDGKDFDSSARFWNDAISCVHMFGRKRRFSSSSTSKYMRSRPFSAFLPLVEKRLFRFIHSYVVKIKTTTYMCHRSYLARFSSITKHDACMLWWGGQRRRRVRVGVIYSCSYMW